MKYILTFILFLPALVFAQPEIKQLPVTCVTPQEAEKIINSTQDSVLLTGVSEIYQRPTAVFYNTQTKTYVFLLFTAPNEVCFVDAGKGTAKGFGTETTL